MKSFPASTLKQRGFVGWSTHSILVTAALGLVCGALIVPMVYAYAFFQSLGPLVLWAMTGIYFFPAFFIAYCIRRPGAALLGLALVGLAQLPFTPVGAAFLVSALLRGILVEPLVALVTRYRAFGWGRMVVLGATTGLLFLLIFGVLLGTASFPLAMQLMIAAASTLSCTIGAVAAKALADAIARTGILSGILPGNDIATRS
ncbi:MAG: ECF transporter S component [Chloroflexaceae bacterium]|jgi:ABC-type thiamin/hydroxymethylpyrimidine transport system permease subunit|nr:ECF transporter S component [Chloroflexaceae bacterium]